MEVFTTYEIVKKLIGKTEPVGETNEDQKRYSNLEYTIELVGLLIRDIKSAAIYSDRPEASMKVIGQKAFNELVYLNEFISEILKNDK
jgi:hypothetical protein